MKLKIKVGVSNRHIHLSENDYKELFGDREFRCLKELSQDGDFASDLVLSIKTNKDIINNVRVVGPLRDKTQVEISRTDAYKLGINPPVRMSGNFDSASDIILCNNNIEILCKKSCIIANRHIHINTRDQEKYNLFSDDNVKVMIDGYRGGILNNVLVKVKDNYNLELHLDTDEANAMGIKNGDIVEVIKGE